MVRLLRRIEISINSWLTTISAFWLMAFYFLLNTRNKNIMKKTSISLCSTTIIGIIAFTLCSFSNSVNKTSLVRSGNDYGEVYEFIYEHVCKPISERPAKKENAVKYFGRCPSGYDANISTKTDSVKVDRYVNGSIVKYVGCSPKYICDFKVCVAKGFAVVRDKGSKDYISVSEWIAKHDKDPQAVPVYTKKKIKG